MWWKNPQERIACTQLFYAVGGLVNNLATDSFLSVVIPTGCDER
jgi:hypothetical protein